MWKRENKTFQEHRRESNEKINSIPQEELNQLKKIFFRHLEDLQDILGGRNIEELLLRDPFSSHEIFVDALMQDDIDRLLSEGETVVFTFLADLIFKNLTKKHYELILEGKKDPNGEFEIIKSELVKRGLISQEDLDRICKEEPPRNTTEFSRNDSDPIIEIALSSHLSKDFNKWLESLKPDIESGDILTSVECTTNQQELSSERNAEILRTVISEDDETDEDLDIRPTLSIPIKAPEQFADTQAGPEYTANGTPKELPRYSVSAPPQPILMDDSILSLPPDAPLSDPPAPNRPTSLPQPRIEVERDGMIIEYEDGEDLENLVPFKTSLVYVITNRGYRKVIPAPVGKVTIGGHITNTIGFGKDEDRVVEDTVTPKPAEIGAYVPVDFMAEITMDENGKFHGKYINGHVLRSREEISVELPDGNPFPLDVKQGLKVGNYLIIIDRRSYTKLRYMSSMKERILQLSQIIFDVNRSNKTDDMEAHDAIATLIAELKDNPEEQQILLDHCREKYAEGTAELLKRLSEWTEENPTCDSKIIDQLMLLIAMKRKNPDMIEDLDYNRFHLIEAANRRIETYGKMAKKAFGTKAKALIGLASKLKKHAPSTEELKKLRQDLMKYRLELVKFIEMNLLPLKDFKNMPKEFQTDINAILGIRSFIREIMSEATVEELNQARDKWEKLFMFNYFTPEEIEIMSLKTNKRLHGAVQETPEPVSADQGRRTRLPHYNPSTMGDLVFTIGSTQANEYMGKIQAAIEELDYTYLVQHKEHLDFLEDLIDSGFIKRVDLVRDNHNKEHADEYITEWLQKARDMIEEVKQN